MVLVDHLDIQGTAEQIEINTITSSNNIVEFDCISFTLSSMESFEAYVLPDLDQSQRPLSEQLDIHNYPHLCAIEFPAVNLKRVSILVGNNIPYAHIQKEVTVPKEESKRLYSCRYPLGWRVSGRLGVKDTQQRASINFFSVDRKPVDLVDDYGGVKSGEKSLSAEDKRAMQIIEYTTQLVNGHYEVGMLWKKDLRQFPNNLVMARQRLESLRSRLYREVMNSYISSGFARKLSEGELAKESNTHWYLLTNQ